MDGGRLAATHQMADLPQPGPVRAQPGDLLARAVAGAVVHDDDFERREAREHGFRLGEDGGDIADLVADGDHQRDMGRRDAHAAAVLRPKVRASSPRPFNRKVFASRSKARDQPANSHVVTSAVAMPRMPPATTSLM